MTTKMRIGVTVLLLGMGLGWVSLALSAPAPRPTIQVVASFTFPLQPDVWHGFLLGPTSADGAYVVEVSPLNGANSGGHIVSRVQTETDGSNWSDVARIQVLGASDAVNVQVRIYAIGPR